MADVKRLIFSILTFLEDQKKTGGLDDDQVDSLDVAIQCLEIVYGLSTSDQNQTTHYHVQRNLLDIFNSQLSETELDFSSLSLHEPTPEEREEAEKFKTKGNDFMVAERYSDALESYSQAIKRDGKNAVYYCNRAAALSKLNKHQQAIEDCNSSLRLDPSYNKAYARMGIAFSALNDNEAARECYRKALELDPDNQSYQKNLEVAEKKIREASAGAGFAAGPVPGMMPDFSLLMNNPQLMDMAANMMSNPHLQSMLSTIMSNQAIGEESMRNLVQVGQQLAAHVQQENPELVEMVRNERHRTNQPGNDNRPENP